MPRRGVNFQVHGENSDISVPGRAAMRDPMIAAIKCEGEQVRVDWEGLTATVQKSGICFAHLGLRLLGTLRGSLPRALPPALEKDWDARFGKGWRKKDDSCGKIARALIRAAESAGLSGAILWDTMRTGSDYWRPGGLLLKVADRARTLNDTYSMAYSRDDAFCPPAGLLAEFRDQSRQMGFGEYANAYAAYLQQSRLADRAAAEVLLGLATKRLPVFYCTDPYIPGYLPSAQLMSPLSYKDRCWLPDLPNQGCHRVILAEEVVRAFLALGVPVKLLEIDPTFGQVHVRAYH